MLRISVKEGEQVTTIVVEGKLVPPWLSELSRTWESSVAGGNGSPIMVDLSGVTFVDREGRELLGRMHRAGARLRTSGCLMKAIVEEIESQSSAQVRSEGLCAGAQPE